MKLSKVIRYGLARLRWFAHWRCSEPVVVFESDDWGMKRGGNVSAFEPYGKIRDWTAEKNEISLNLENLYEVLDRHQDKIGRSAVLTANFITANPDFNAIQSNNYSKYIDIPISAEKTLLPAWKEGFERKIFYPQYHGRSHIWVENWLDDLKKDYPGARDLFNKRQNGGLALLRNANWRYHSEYINWRKGTMLPTETLLDWLKQGLGYFYDSFGFYPKSMIAPHYVLPNTVLSICAESGISIIQGGNYHIVRNKKSGKPIIVNHVMGEHSVNGLLYLVRNVRFEPRPSQKERGLEQAWEKIQLCFKAGIPAVIDTHRINYTGPWQNESLAALDELLTRIDSYHPIYMTSEELGSAIQSHGKFEDSWDRNKRSLKSRERICQKRLRRLFSSINSKLLI